MNKDTDVYEHALLAVQATERSREDGLLVRRGNGKSDFIVTPKKLHRTDKAGLTRWSGIALGKLAAAVGQTNDHWVRCSRTHLLCLVPDDFRHGVKRRKSTTGLCWEYVHDSIGVTLHFCSRPIFNDDHLCAMHRAASNRSDASMAAHRARWAAADEQSRRAGLATADLRKLWAEVCAQRDIVRPGEVRVDTASRAVVDNEILGTLLRELLEISSM